MDLVILLKVTLFGIVEGLTEFLPVSSTGHLLVAEKMLGFKSEFFTVFIQMGALLPVWWLFRDRFFKMLPGPRGGGVTGQRVGRWVLLAFLPVVPVGLLTHHWITEHLFSPKGIAWALIVGGIVILLVEGLKPRVRQAEVDVMTWKTSLLIGLGQCLALCPGVSRSGATIMTGMVAGVGRAAATEFTFLLSAPTMTAATVYELVKYRKDLHADMLPMLAVGFLVSAVVAYAMVKWLIQFVQTHTFEGFAWYRIVAGALLLALVSNGWL